MTERIVAPLGLRVDPKSVAQAVVLADIMRRDSSTSTALIAPGAAE